MRTAIALSGILLLLLPPWGGRLAAETPDAHEVEPLDVLMIAPHPDDEAIGCGGVMLRAIKAGRRVGVVLLTGGDGYPQAAAVVAKKAEPQLAPADFLQLAAVRRRHSVDALTGIGVRAADLISLGFPDSGLTAIYEARDETPYRQPFTGKTETYGTVIRDYHTLTHGRPAPYTRSSVLADLVEIIKARRPREMYVTDEADTHADHRTAFRFVRDAANAAAYRGKLFSFVVHGTPPDEPDRRVVLTDTERVRKRALIEKYQTHLSPIHDDLAETYAGPEELFRLVPLTGAQPYEGKTSAQWIEVLSSSAAASERSKAAEALGFMAREESQTYGGFSDVPIDSEEAVKLTDDELDPIVAALIAGLSDAQPHVRASSAIALSWIGPRASAAVPALIERIDDANGDARSSALDALGRIGASGKAAIPKLRAQLKHSGGKEQTEVAEALRLVGDDSSYFIPTLIARMARDHRAAIELALVGDPAVPALLNAFTDKNPDTRKSAAYSLGNMAGWEKLTKNKEEVAEALLELAKDEDRGVVFSAAHAIGSVHAAAERCVPVLVGLLKHHDDGVVDAAAESLGEFAAAARPALAALVELLATEEQETNAACAIREIGIDRASAEAIGKLKLADGGSWLLVPLLKYPNAALEFVRNNPEAVDVPMDDRDELIRLLRHPEPALKPIQEALYQNEQLPLAIMAALGDSRFLPLIKRRLKTASAHDKPRLAACARACGAPLGRVVQIDASRPGDFKPKSAWPDVDASRMAADSHGHGDGFTEVIVTGQILRSDGKPVDKPALFRMNDAMLLGERTREEEPITYDPKTGRFVYITIVFAAYSHGGGKREPGPYQTGSSLVQIEATGCQPLRVQFYDEMPDVRVTLTADGQSPKK